MINLIQVGNFTIFSDRVDGYSDIIQEKSGKDDAYRFTIYMSSGRDLTVTGPKSQLIIQQKHLHEKLLEVEDDYSHPMGKS